MTTKEMIEVMQAFEEGKQIQVCSTYYDSSTYYDNWCNINNPTWDWLNFKFRIKPESELMPYKNADEFLKAQKEHGPYLQRFPNGVFRIPTEVGGKGICFSNDEIDSYEDLVECKAKWQDGTPCGVVNQ